MPTGGPPFYARVRPPLAGTREAPIRHAAPLCTGLLLVLAACAEDVEVVEGTWLFRVEREPSSEEACDTDSDDHDGYSHALVDVYLTEDDQVVVLFEEALVGSFDGETLLASWEESRVTGTTVSTDALVLDATVDAGRMEGDLTRHLREADFVCDEAYDFEAERIVSDAGAYARDR